MPSHSRLLVFAFLVAAQAWMQADPPPTDVVNTTDRKWVSWLSTGDEYKAKQKIGKVFIQSTSYPKDYKPLPKTELVRLPAQPILGNSSYKVSCDSMLMQDPGGSNNLIEVVDQQLVFMDDNNSSIPVRIYSKALPGKKIVNLFYEVGTYKDKDGRELLGDKPVQAADGKITISGTITRTRAGAPTTP